MAAEERAAQRQEELEAVRAIFCAEYTEVTAGRHKVGKVFAETVL
jgi:hypothetical protein